MIDLNNLRAIFKMFYAIFLVFGLCINITAVISNLVAVSAQYSDARAAFVYLNLLGVVIFMYSIKKEVEKYLESKKFTDEA